MVGSLSNWCHYESLCGNCMWRVWIDDRWITSVEKKMVMLNRVEIHKNSTPVNWQWSKNEREFLQILENKKNRHLLQFGAPSSTKSLKKAIITCESLKVSCYLLKAIVSFYKVVSVDGWVRFNLFTWICMGSIKLDPFIIWVGIPSRMSARKEGDKKKKKKFLGSIM